EGIDPLHLQPFLDKRGRRLIILALSCRRGWSDARGWGEAVDLRPWSVTDFEVEHFHWCHQSPVPSTKHRLSPQPRKVLSAAANSMVARRNAIGANTGFAVRNFLHRRDKAPYLGLHSPMKSPAQREAERGWCAL